MEDKRIKVGIAPIGWTNDDLPDLGSENTFEQCVSEMALAGFRGCEVGNKFPRDKKVLKKALALRGLQLIGADVVELSPHYDPSGVSTAVACKALRETLILLSA
jgi:sugar phosphate isomerase/epimerase